MAKHLWEIDHPYYCSDSNYFAPISEAVREFKPLDEFLGEFGDSDLDYNAIFRFDWKEGEDENLGEYSGDDYYRYARLHVYWIGQRKGAFHVSIVEVCRADEPPILNFLKPRFDYLMRLWEPFSDAATT